MDGTGSQSSRGERDTGSESTASEPLELFFDLVFVFAFTRVTAFVAHHQTWTGVIRGIALLAVLWWAWVTYTWLMNTISAEQVLSERVVVLAASAVMFIVAIAVPNAFGGTAALFGAAYFTVRAIHVGLTVRTIDSETQDRFVGLVPGILGGPALLLAAGFTDDPLQAVLWIAGIAIDYGVLWVRGVAKFEVNVEHFVERYRDVVIIAFGESVLAMGFAIVGDEATLPPGVVLAGFLGIVLVTALAGLYFDYVTYAAEDRFAATEGYDRGIVARNSYAYLHFPIIAGAIFVAFGLEVTVTHVAEPLGVIPAVGLYGGTALYLLGHTAFRFHETGSVSVARVVTAGVVCALLTVATRVPALVALALLTALLLGLAVVETRLSSIRREVVHD